MGSMGFLLKGIFTYIFALSTWIANRVSKGSHAPPIDDIFTK